MVAGNISASVCILGASIDVPWSCPHRGDQGEEEEEEAAGSCNRIH